MKKLLLLLASLGLFAVGCQNNLTDETIGGSINDSTTITVSLNDTRISLGEKDGDSYPVYWSEGDKITVNGVLSEEAQINAENKASATFQFSKVLSHPLHITYPYCASTTAETPIVEFPAEQTYAEGTFTSGYAPMCGYAESKKDAIKLNHLAGVLRFSVKAACEGVVLEKIVITSQNKIAGEFAVDCQNATISATESCVNVVTYTLPADYALSTTAPSEFFITLPAVELGACTIEFVETSGEKMVANWSMNKPLPQGIVREFKTITYKQGATISLPSFTSDEDDFIIEKPKQPNNEIWYKSVDGNIRVPYYTTGFGAKYTTNEYNVESGYWIISFDGDVTTIPAYAFCNHNGSFGITEILLPQSLTTIESNAFYYCLELQDVYIPNNVNTIKDYAFNRCSGIQAFYGKYASSDNRCIIKDGVIISFATSGIDKYTTPSDANAIGRFAFYGATISSLTVTNNITTIGNEAFSNSLLESVVLPNSITAIPYGAFGNCYNLVSCNMPSAITTIGSNAFKYCSSLKTFTLPSTITTIGTNAFKNTQIETLYILCNIPDDNSGSGINAYFYSANIGHAIIGEQVTSIGKSAFVYSNIQKLTLGENISSIGRYALYDCKLLTEVYCKSSTPPFAEYSFSNLTSINKIYVPASDDDSIITAYKSAIGWSNYAAYIEEYDFTE